MAAENNVLFVAPDQVLGQDYYPVGVSGGAWQTTAPASNILIKDRAVVARSVDTSTSSTKMVVDLGTPREISAVVVPWHNLSVTARTQVSLYMDSGLTNLSGTMAWADVYPEMIEFGAVEWGHPSAWNGRPTAESIRTNPAPVIHLAEGFITGRYLLVEVDDTGNGNGYIEVSRVIAGFGYQPSINASYGLSTSYVDQSIVVQTLGGGIKSSGGAKRRVVSGAINFLPTPESMASLGDMRLTLGSTGEVFFCRDPTDLINRNRNAFVGHFSDAGEQTDSAFDRQDNKFSIEEITS
jgi:hypothetical protein